MKVFKVVVERGRDGTLTKVPGITSAEVERLDYYYAAKCIEDVWGYVEFIRLDPDLSLIGIVESVQAIHIIEGTTY